MFGERLKLIREKHGLTQEDLARELGVTPSTISGYETGRNSPNDDIKVSIARRFDVSLDYLLGAIDEQFPLNRSNSIDVPVSFTRDDIADVNRYIQFIKSKSK